MIVTNISHNLKTVYGKSIKGTVTTSVTRFPVPSIPFEAAWIQFFGDDCAVTFDGSNPVIDDTGKTLSNRTSLVVSAQDFRFARFISTGTTKIHVDFQIS